jgi:para-nitrobenzyl esterase
VNVNIFNAERHKSIRNHLAASMFGFAVLLLSHSAFADSPQTLAVIESGTLQGAISDGVLSFKGIPYAAAPTGELRWRAPQAAAHWSSVRDATQFGADCMQAIFPMDAAKLRGPLSEDCLYLNVWRSADTGGQKLPVVVWIHGGGFVNGGSSAPIYSGDAFAKKGVVFVSFNYRLGRFGFFAFPALTAEHPEEPKANYGLLDQIAALQWVQRNIAAFGGDPQNVTVMGESAGGMAINILMTSPMGKGLFQRAIIESGGGRTSALGTVFLDKDMPAHPSAETIGVNFAQSQGISGTDAAALAKLRALPADQVTSGLNMMTMVMAIFTGLPSTFAGPTIDGRLFVQEPEAAWNSGHGTQIPVIVGANDRDLGLSLAPSIDAALAPFGNNADLARKAYDPNGTGNLSDINAAVGADKMMIEPARFVARSASNAGATAYEFRFGYVSASDKANGKRGAEHASEIPFVFDTLPAISSASPSALDMKVAGALNSYWANFAKTGDPNGSGLAPWTPYGTSGDSLLAIQPDGSFESHADPLKERLDLTAALAAGLAK